MASSLEIVATVAASAISAFAPLIAAKQQDRREARVRAAIVGNLELAKILREFSPESEEVNWLNLHIRSQVESLIQRERKVLQRKRDWGDFYITLLFGLPAAPGLYWLWKPQHWWSWVAFVALSIYAFAVVFFASLAIIYPAKNRNQSPGAPKGAEKSGAEAGISTPS